MATAKHSPVKKPVKATAKVSRKPAATRAKKPAVKKSATKAPKSTKVDYYPNRMTFWVSAAAGSLIVLIALICAYNR